MYLMNLKNHINNNNINKDAIEDVFVEAIVIFNDNKEEIKEKVKNIGGSFLDLYQGFGIITVKLKELECLKNIEGIEKIEPPKGIFFKDFNDESVVVDYENGLDEFQSAYENNKYKLTGKGVLIGFVDSGVDFTHIAFKDFDNKTRIKYIYNINENKVYDEVDIENALKEKEPFEFLGEGDLKGHGTKIASVAAGGGMIPRKYYGVASESTLMMAKLDAEGTFKNSWEVQVLKGIRFLIERSIALKMPLVINLSVNSNSAVFLEEYLNRMASLENITVVASVGNSGDKERHFSDKFSNNNEVSWNISLGERRVLMTLRKKKIDSLNIKINLPKGEDIEFKDDDEYKYFLIKNNKIEIFKDLNPFDDSLEIIKIFIRNDEEDIPSGKWTMFLNNQNSVGNPFELWLPISRSINEETRFFNATRESTILAPALSEGVISVGSCNVNYELSVFSAIGVKKGEMEIKPNIMAEGERLLAATGNWFAYKSGTSVAAARVSGVVALLMEWGIVRGYDKELYGTKLKYYIQLAAVRSKYINYPNNEQGYGVISFKETIGLLENTQ